MNSISFMTANFVARQVGYHMTDWMHGQNAVMEYFRPIQTYSARLGGMLDEICALGFEAIDLWLAHLSPEWATDEHIACAQEALAQRGLKVSSLAGGFGETPEAFERSCRLARAMGTRILGGMAGALYTDRAATLRLLEKYDVVLAIENHAEKTPAEVLAEIGDGGFVPGKGPGHIMACVDTANGTFQGWNAAQAIIELGPQIVYVHLKDALADRHESCRYGQGTVPLERCVRLLLEMGYQGGFCVEHEPHNFDPREDVQASFGMLKGWLGK